MEDFGCSSAEEPCDAFNIVVSCSVGLDQTGRFGGQLLGNGD